MTDAKSECRAAALTAADESSIETPRAGARQLLRTKVEGYLNLIRIHREIEARALALLENAGIEGMTMAQATALLVLVQERTPITATRLAGLLNVSTVTVGRFVRSLEHNGWLDRRPDPNDARAMLIAPTKQTHDALEVFVAVTEQIMSEAYRGFVQRDIENVLVHLAEIRKNLYRVAGKPDTDPQSML